MKNQNPRIERIRSTNAYKMYFSDGTIALRSYYTPVALNLGSHIIASKSAISVTTSKHINEFIREFKLPVERVTQSQIYREVDSRA